MVKLMFQTWGLKYPNVLKRYYKSYGIFKLTLNGPETSCLQEKRKEFFLLLLDPCQFISRHHLSHGAQRLPPVALLQAITTWFINIVNKVSNPFIYQQKCHFSNSYQKLELNSNPLMSCLGCLWVIFGSSLGCLWFVFGSSLGHLWVVFG